MKLLGLDYGDKYIGLAIADSETKLASPLKIIANEIEDLKKIIAEEQIEKIIVGLPVGMVGKTSEQLIKTKEFIELLKNNFDILIETEDERFSTAAANTLIKEQKKKGEREDAVAAMLILQSYLDRK